MPRIADYELVKELGQGNHGTFYLALPPARLELDAEFVALKTLDRNATDADFDRLARELGVFSSLRSRYLVELYDAGQQEGRLFYAQRYYADGALGAAAKLDAKAAMRAVADAARGAHALHEVGVVHRDIKPGNIMISGGRGHLGDLGLAQVWGPGMTTTGVGPIGSIAYMEPEVIYGQRALRTSDVWSLGVTLHEALTGRPCHDNIPTGSVLDAFRHVLHEAPSVDPSLEQPIQEVISRAVAPTRGDRFQTAEAFATELEKAGGLLQ